MVARAVAAVAAGAVARVDKAVKVGAPARASDPLTHPLKRRRPTSRRARTSALGDVADAAVNARREPRAVI